MPDRWSDRAWVRKFGSSEANGSGNVQTRYFKITKEEKLTLIELLLPAEIDTAAFGDITRDLVDAWPVVHGSRVVVDLTGGRYAGSMLLGLLVNIRQRARANGGDAVYCGLSQSVLKAIATTHLERLLVVVPTRRDAMG